MKRVVAGVGNSDRGDDGFGIEVVDRLAADPPKGVILSRCRGDMAALIETISSADMAIVVDAMMAGGRPGQIRRLDAKQPLSGPSARFSSTHGINLAETIELARALEKLPPALIVYGVEARDFSIGRGLSPPVAAAVQRVAAAIRHDCR